MADSKLADLPAITTPADDDLLYVVHDPAGTPVDRKITVANLLGASSRWTQRVAEAAAALTNWTSIAGTWAASGGVFTQSDTAAAYRGLRYNSLVRSGAWIIEVKIRFPTSGQAGSGTIMAGMNFGGDGVAGDEPSFPGFRLSRPFNSTSGNLEVLANGAVPAITPVTVALDTFYKVRMVTDGGMAVLYVDGVETLGAQWAPSANPHKYPTVFTFGSKADFDDINVWTATGDLPA